MRSPHPDTSLSSLGKRKAGRPTKRCKEIEERLFKALSQGAPYSLACGAAGIHLDTFIAWRRANPAFQAEVDRIEAECALRRLRAIERAGQENWSAHAWLLERRHPEMFGRPEIQLNLIAQNNTVENHLTINITGTEAMEIERQAQPVREKVSEMISAYRPFSWSSSERGDGDGEVRNIEAESVSGDWTPPPISHCETDATNPGFWSALVSSSRERKVVKGTAVFAIRTLLTQIAGYKGHRAQITFDHDPVTIEELFDRLERLCGGPAGRQLAQKLGGFSPPTVSA
jgi:hypothetical protein